MQLNKSLFYTKNIFLNKLPFPALRVLFRLPSKRDRIKSLDRLIPRALKTAVC